MQFGNLRRDWIPQVCQRWVATAATPILIWFPLDNYQAFMSEQVRLMFTELAERYDAGNDVLSFGTHRLWKRRLVRRAAVRPGAQVLDVATGTGDIALRFADAVGPQGRVIGADFSAKMIQQAKQRPNNQKPNLSFEVGDAMNLRFPDGTFDISSISFGIRNVDDPVVALREMRRVLKPGGRIVVMEFGQPRGLFGALYRFYTSNIGPIIGGLISGKRSAYEYLDRTAAAFPAGQAFLELMHQAGFQNPTKESLFGGIAFIYVGVKSEK